MPWEEHFIYLLEGWEGEDKEISLTLGQKNMKMKSFETQEDKSRRISGY